MRDSNEMTGRVVEAVRGLMASIPTVEVRQFEGEPRSAEVGGELLLHHCGSTYAVFIVAAAEGGRRSVREAIPKLKGRLMDAMLGGGGRGLDKLVPVVASSYLSPEARVLCTEHKMGYFDLVGNARLQFGDVYVERSLAEKPKTKARALRSMFSPKAAAILRLLMAEPGRPWRVAELAETAQVSLGHVSSVRKALLERGLVVADNKGMALTSPYALMAKWRENYRKPLGKRVTGHTRLPAQLLAEAVSGLLNRDPRYPLAVYAKHSAASWYAPWVRGAGHTFYTDERGAELLANALELVPTRAYANVSLLTVEDTTLFADADEPRPGVVCVNPLVIYLDLWNGNDRDQEGAQHLGRKMFPWLPVEH